MYKQPENRDLVKYMKNRFEKLDVEKNNRPKINNNTNDKNINNNDYKNICSQNQRRDKELINDENIDIKDRPTMNLTRQLSDPSKKGCIKRTPAFRKEKFVNSKVKSELSFASKLKLFQDHDDNCDNDETDELHTENVEKKLTSSVSFVLNRPLNTTSQKRSSLSPKRTEISPINKSALYKINTVKDIKITPNRMSNDLTSPDSSSPKVNNSFLSSVIQETFASKRTSNLKSKNISDSLISPKNEMPKMYGSPKYSSSYNDNSKNSPKRSPVSLKKDSSPQRYNKYLTDKNIISPRVSPKLRRNEMSSTKLTETKIRNIPSPKSPQKIPVKIREKSKVDSKTRTSTVSFIKDMLENQTNDKLEAKLLDEKPTKIPEYAQVNKPKKKDVTFPDNLTDTLKAALKQPLPAGPPPKKPPRTFAHIVLEEKLVASEKLILDPTFTEKLNENLKKAEPEKTKIKSDPKLMLQKLENALLNNKIRSPKLPKKIKTTLESKSSLLNTPSSSNQYTTEPNLYTNPTQKNLFPNCLASLNCSSSDRQSYSQVSTLDSKSTFFVEKNEEPIYAEPFEFQVRETVSPNESESKRSTISRSVHYLSSPVSASVGSPADIDNSDKLTRTKLKLIMNHTYASLPHSDSDDIDSLVSTPTSDSPTLPPKTNQIREAIAKYEKQLKRTESFRLPPDIKRRLNRQYLTNGADSEMVQIENDLEADNDYVNIEREKQKIKAEFRRSMTEIRKCYVRRVCSTVRRRKRKELDESPNLFECCLLVELNMSDLTPYIKGKYPLNYELPQQFEYLCYPDSTEWNTEILLKDGKQNGQCYSLVITNEKGERKFGYCRRVLPEEASVCLPLTYCIISSFRAPGFYFRVLEELESRHGLPHLLQNAFVQELYNSKFPKPGESVKLSCLLRVLLVNSCEKLNDTRNGVKKSEEKDWVIYENKITEEYSHDIQKNIYGILNKLKLNQDELIKIDNYVKEFRNNSLNPRFECDTSYVDCPRKRLTDLTALKRCDSDDFDIDSFTKMLHLPNTQLIHDCLLGDVKFTRPYDHRIEDTDLTILFETLNLSVLLQIFGSLLHERKVILVGKSLSQLSSCVEALQSILYPFSWQHTFIPVLAGNMLDVLSAPLPLVAGVLASHLPEEWDIEEGMAVNLDTSTILYSVGDEPGILPKRLRNGLSLALHTVTSSSSVDGSRNVLVSEAFMRMFVEVCGHYRQFISRNEDGEKVFDKEGFIKHHTSKSTQSFLEWFTETATFQTFIYSENETSEGENIFEKRCVEFLSEKQKNKSNLTKMKNFFKT